MLMAMVTAIPDTQVVSPIMMAWNGFAMAVANQCTIKDVIHRVVILLEEEVLEVIIMNP
jgi:hypothetical protein